MSVRYPELNPRISDYVPISSKHHPTPSKSYLRSFWEAICAIAKKIFNFFDFRKNKSEPQVAKKFSNINPKPTHQVKRSRIFTKSKDAVLEKPASTKPSAAAIPLVPPTHSELLSGDLIRHLSKKARPVAASEDELRDTALELGNQVLDALSIEIMQKNVFPHVPKITECAQEIEKSINTITSFLRYLKNRFGTSDSSHKPEKALKLEDKVHSRLLLNTLKLIVDTKDVDRFLDQFLVTEKSSEKLLPFILPTIDWLKESYKNKQGIAISLKEFLTKNRVKYQIKVVEFDALLPELVEFALKKFSEHLVSHLKVHMEGQKAVLKQLEDPITVIQSAQELIEVNAQLVTENVINRLFDLLKKMNFSDLLYHNLPQFTNQLQGKAAPAVESHEPQQQGAELIDLIFPVVQDKAGNPSTTVEVLLKQIHVPQLIKEIHLPDLSEILAAVITRIKGVDELSRDQKQALKDLLADGKELLILATLKSEAAAMIEQLIDKIKDPYFIHEKMAELVLPITIEKMLSIFAKQVLSRNIDPSLLYCFRQLTNAKSLMDIDSHKPLTIKSIIEELISKWKLLMDNHQKGFKAFGEYSEEDKEYGMSKFKEIVYPILMELGDHLLSAKEAYGDEFNDRQIMKVLQHYFNPTHNTKGELPLSILLEELTDEKDKDDVEKNESNLRQVANKLLNRSSYEQVQFAQPKELQIVSPDYLVPFLRNVSNLLKHSSINGPKEVKEAIEASLVIVKPKKNGKHIEAFLLDYFHIPDDAVEELDETLNEISDALLTTIQFSEGEVEFSLKQTGITTAEFLPAVRVFINRIEAALKAAGVECVDDVNLMNEIIHQLINPKLTAVNRFMELILAESDFYDQKWVTKKLSQYQWAQSLIKSQIHSVSQIMLDSMLTMDELLELTLKSLQKQWTTEVNGAKKIDINKVLLREQSHDQQLSEMIMKQSLDKQAKQEMLDNHNRRVKLEKLPKLFLKLQQMTALITDLSSQAAYHGSSSMFSHLAYMATKSVTSPKSLNIAIMKIYDKLFADPHRNKHMLTAVFKTILADLNIASEELSATPLSKRVALA